MKKTKKRKPEMHLAYNPDIGAVDRTYALEHLKRAWYQLTEEQNIRPTNVLFMFNRYHLVKWRFTKDEINESNPTFSNKEIEHDS